MTNILLAGLLLSLAANAWLYFDLRNAQEHRSAAVKACDMWRKIAGDATEGLLDASQQRAAAEANLIELAQRHETLRQLYIGRTQDCLRAALGNIRLGGN